MGEGAMSSTRSANPLVTIGIVTWNSAGDLPACLDAVQAQTYPHLELIVVDNASEDGSAGVARNLAPGVSLIKLNENRGYGAAHNRAIGAAHGNYYLALNPDVVMQPEYVAHLVDALEARPECGSAMGKFWLARPSEPGEHVIDATGLFIDRQRHQYLRGHGELDQGQYDSPGEVFGVDGAAPLYRSSALQDLQVEGQVFDETYFVHMEDVDLAWRARLLGWKAWYEPQAMAIHDRTFRPGERRLIAKTRRRDAVKNRYMTIIKNEAPATWRRDWWRILSYDARIIAYVLFLEQSSLGAYTLLFRQRRVLRRWREKIWAKVRVKPEERKLWFG